MTSSITRQSAEGGSRRSAAVKGLSSSVEKLGREMMELGIKDKRRDLEDDSDFELDIVDGRGAEAGHIIATTIGGQNGHPKQAITYIAEHVIGTGSFGVVFQAKCRETGEIVAIKKVLQDKRYKNRELQLMHMLDHPNIVSLKQSFAQQSFAVAIAQQSFAVQLQQRLCCAIATTKLCTTKLCYCNCTANWCKALHRKACQCKALLCARQASAKLISY